MKPLNSPLLSSVFFGLLLFIIPLSLWSQEPLTMETYLSYVKKHHPFVKQAQLKLTESEAKLLKQRGAFDPKLSFDQKQKTFNGTTYYKKEEAKLSIPSYYGITLDATMQQAEGNYLNPENTVSGERLLGVGASIELGRGLLSNPRQTALKQAKLFTKQAKEENALEINEILTAASNSYLDWYKNYLVYKIFDQFVSNAKFRFEGVKKRMENGDLALIDTIEARIAYNQRRLDRENAHLEWQKKALSASNYLWIEQEAVVINETLYPEVNEEKFFQRYTTDTIIIENHPKLRALGFKQNQMLLEQRLQRNNLLPQVSLHYQWLSDNNPLSQINFALDPANNTTGIKISYPLFLRKERANVKIAALKLKDIEWEQTQSLLSLENKIKALYFQKERLKKQKEIALNVVSDYQSLLEGEKQKFEAGESSLFLVNTRESKLIEVILKSISLDIAQKKAEITYYYAINFEALAQG